MKALFALISLFALASADNWAVLVAGSDGFGNYRHQADVSHAYQIMKRGGIPEDHIIVLMKDDVANSQRNPFPGELYNHPGDDAKNVYEGVKVDYRMEEATAGNFHKILRGDKTTGAKVLESTEKDNVFIFFSDHGGADILCFPDEYVHSADLMETFKYMHEHKMYKKLVFYVEACYSGSMFLNLPNDWNILAVTAANDHESSWGWYCGSEAVVKGKNIGSCLGDEFSVYWMEDTDKGEQETESLLEQFNRLVSGVTKSHVCKYGDEGFMNDMIAEYVGAGGPAKNAPKHESSVAWDSRDNNLLYYKYMYDTTKSEEFKQLYLEELSIRQQIDRYFNSLRSESRFYAPLNGPVREVACYKKAVEQYKALFGMADYGLKYFEVYAHMCEENSNAF